MFSVIIPTLNEENYLPHILEDLKNQEKQNFEVIIVDGKSDDKTKEVALQFAKKIPLQFITVEKRNVSFQRNTGAQKANGKYLIFIDADTRIPKDFTKNLETSFEKRGYKLVLPTISWDDKSRKAKILHSVVTSVIRASQVYGRPLSTGGNFAIEKELFNSIGGFNEDVFISEDHDLVRKAYDFGVKAKIVKNVRATISMRRGALEGDATFIYKNILGFLTYTMSPNEKALKRKLFKYEMGGHMYEDKSKGKNQNSKLSDDVDKNENLKIKAKGLKLNGETIKNLRKKLDMARLKELLQLGVIVTLLKNIKF
ncbi:MAG TPA: glycosyltransferase [Patescibacteria group bacterium]